MNRSRADGHSHRSRPYRACDRPATSAALHWACKGSRRDLPRAAPRWRGQASSNQKRRAPVLCGSTQTRQSAPGLAQPPPCAGHRVPTPFRASVRGNSTRQAASVRPCSKPVFRVKSSQFPMGFGGKPAHHGSLIGMHDQSGCESCKLLWLRRASTSFTAIWVWRARVNL